MANLLEAAAPLARGMLQSRPVQLLMDLELSPKSIHHAKSIVIESLRLWGFDELAEDIGLTIAELLTNVLLHATPERAEDVKTARCLVQRMPGGVVTVVHDDDPTVPSDRDADHDRYAVGGRGLLLVRGLASEVTITLSPPGKDVTAIFLHPTAA